ncbi:MAG: class I SAM-dependent methyltransferase [Acidobacteriota bacterium]|jgi:ubiquinone/menaquinone biosynthesis C-methylase UbiE
MDAARAAFFDAIAPCWDGWHDLPRLAAQLAAGLAELGVGREEAVLDLGCGTGNLTAALLARLSPAGRVVAVDFSPRMVALARAKLGDPRVRWRVAAAEALPLPEACVDRVVALAVWPHLGDREGAATELMRVLRPGGLLHIWHLSAREEVNRIHAAADGPIRGDLLPPAGETAALLARAGFAVQRVEDGERYLVTVRAREGR